jgi:hypothetical protein
MADREVSMNIVEVERGLKTCQCVDCKTDARWKADGQYYCLKHWKELLAHLSQQGIVITVR